MLIGEELGLGGIATLGAVASVCAVLLRSTHLNLKTLDTLRHEAHTAADNLRRQLRDHDDTIFRLQGLCTEYRFALAKLEDDNQRLRRALKACGSLQIQNPDESPAGKRRLPNPEDVL